MEKPEVFARIRAYIAVEKLTPPLVETLLCRKAKSENVVEKAKKYAKDGQDEAQDRTKAALEKTKDTLRTLGDVVGDATREVGAVNDALGAAVSLLESAGDILAGVFGVAGALGALLLVPLSGDE